MLSLNPLSVFCHLDLVVVLDLVDLFLQRHTLSVPLKQLALIDTHFAEHLFQTFVLLLLLVDLNIPFFKLVLPCLLYFADFSVFLLLSLIQRSVCILFGLLNLVLELKHQLHVFRIFVGQRLDQNLSVLDLRFELLHQAEVVAPHSQDILLFFLQQSLQFIHIV